MARRLLSNVQILRFAAALAVLLSHAGDLFLPRESFFWMIPWTAGVDIFFVISGFVMVYLTDGQFGRRGVARAFIVRRVLRIVPPYWLFTTLMVATVLLFGEHVRNSEVTPAVLATSYAFVPWPRADGAINPLLSQGWTLNYEAFFYLAFAAALPFRRGLILLSIGFVALSLVHFWLSPDWVAPHFWSQPIILEFIAGIALGKLYLRGVRLSPAAAAMLAVAALAMLLGMSNIDQAMIRPISFGIPALLLCASLALMREPDRPQAWRRTLIAGGDSSYTLYLSHTFTVHAVLLAWGWAGWNAPWLGMAVAVIAAVAAAHILYRLVERPAVDWLQRRFAVPLPGPPRDARHSLR